jgi:hypothetical protein
MTDLVGRGENYFHRVPTINYQLLTKYFFYG